MKRLILFSIVLFNTPLFSQNVKRIRDDSAVGQEKRQVFEKWGEWSPYAKKNWLGFQTNIMYETVWVWDKANRRYKRGEDIRPLKADGLENQRNALNLQIQNQAKKVEQTTTKTKDDNLAELLHVSNTTAKADLLYLTYYKYRLKPFEDVENLQDFKVRYFSKTDVLEKVSSGTIDKYFNDFEILKDKYKMTFSIDMPRGKRMLLYHQSWLDLRRFQTKVNAFIKAQEMYFTHSTKIRKIKEVNRESNNEVNDLKTFRKILRNTDLN